MDEHEYINIDFVRKYPNRIYSLREHSIIVKDLNIIDIESIRIHKANKYWLWSSISEHINIQQVRNNPNKYWNKQYLSSNRTITVKDIETLQLPNSIGEWNWNNISTFINIIEVINNPNKPWDRFSISCNRGTTKKILAFFDAGLLKHLQKNIYTFRYHTDTVIKCEY